MILHPEIRYRQSGRAKVLCVEIMRVVICRGKRFTPCMSLPMACLTWRLQCIVGENSLDILSTQ